MHVIYSIILFYLVCTQLWCLKQLMLSRGCTLSGNRSLMSFKSYIMAKNRLMACSVDLFDSNGNKCSFWFMASGNVVTSHWPCVEVISRFGWCSDSMMMCQRNWPHDSRLFDLLLKPSPFSGTGAGCVTGKSLTLLNHEVYSSFLHVGVTFTRWVFIRSLLPLKVHYQTKQHSTSSAESRRDLMEHKLFLQEYHQCCIIFAI